MARRGSTTTVIGKPAVGDPASRPLPTAEVRQGEDDTGAVRDALPQVPEPLVGEVRGDLDVRAASGCGTTRPSSAAYESNVRSTARRSAAPVSDSPCTRRRWRATMSRRPRIAWPKPMPASRDTGADERVGKDLRDAWRRPGRRRRRPVRQATVIRAWCCDGARPASAPWRWDGRPGGTASATARGRDAPRSPGATPSRTAAPP